MVIFRCYVISINSAEISSILPFCFVALPALAAFRFIPVGSIHHDNHKLSHNNGGEYGRLERTTSKHGRNADLQCAAIDAVHRVDDNGRDESP